MIATFTAGRRLKIGKDFRDPGLPAPEAHLWFRIDDYLHTGYLTTVTVSEADFRAAVDTYAAPAEQAPILEKVGLRPVAKGRKPTTAPVALKERKVPA